MVRWQSESLIPIVAALALLTACPVGGQEAVPSCEDNNCDENATCTDYDEGYTCACMVGYFGDGRSCCPDNDNDTVCDAADNCPDDANPGQEDENSDGVGDACEVACTDTDADTVCDTEDNCLSLPNPGQEDGNTDGVGDVCDPIRHDLATLSTTAQFFTYDSLLSPGTTVAYFAVLGSGGDPHVAFDACDVCYGAGLGYSQEGNEMVCNNCSNRFAIDGIGTANQGGGCWPGYLPITVAAPELTIDPLALEDGAWYFE